MQGERSVNLTKKLKHSFLLLQRTEGCDVGDREGHLELILETCSEIEPSILYAPAAAVGVVGHLRGRILRLALVEIVDRGECGVPAANSTPQP